MLVISGRTIAIRMGTLLAALAIFLMPGPANAVPSYARQTGLACEACHTVFPQLTPFGRIFKASGYTLFNTVKVADINKIKRSILSISDVPPISAMVMASASSSSKANDPQSSNTSTDLPQQASLFYAGRISDNMGAFIQITYDDQDGGFGMDNTDIRWADVAQLDGHDVIYGVSLNNNPTVQDLWNSTPAWGQPYIGSPAQQGPAAATQLEGPLAQVVAGLSAYTFIDESIYLEAGVYHSALQGASVASNGDGNNNVITGVAPYWRAAYEKDWGKNSLEVGALGLYAEQHNPLTPGGNAINQSLQLGPVDTFSDVGLDGQYQYIDDDTQASLNARWIHESQALHASYAASFATNTKDKLDSINFGGSYFWRRELGLNVNWYDVTGTGDPLYLGTANGKPNSAWTTVEADYLPWLNVKLGVQYSFFSELDGAGSNYDGNGRNAADNNLLYGYVWLAF